ncbi:MAG: alcohol dehydrogenase catalytic domain-containing protein [Myxococcota bacterium]|nr:alcohol dehydrogenase catalytic domain-containing protein [Myxococcota bacterium]
MMTDFEAPVSRSGKIGFGALEYQADGAVEPNLYQLEGSRDKGWHVTRNEEPLLSFGPGYVLLRARSCGVCSTDLARKFLPFPLPQIIGHEVLAVDQEGNRFVTEINASHRALGQDLECPYCDNGLHTHCPQRKVLGIHDLPGGFGPFFLAPERGVFKVPPKITDATAVLMEPFAAALHAADTVLPRIETSVAVLGTRRLGLLTVAARAARRRQHGLSFRLIGLSRHQDLQEVARAMGADEASPPLEGRPRGTIADIVIDTTGSPEGLELAIALAHKEVHLKSTHGQRAAGLDHLTEAVVDEIELGHFHPTKQNNPSALAFGNAPRPLVLWQSEKPMPGWLEASCDWVRKQEPDPARMALAEKRPELPAADLVVVDQARGVDQALRPWADQEQGLVRARGRIEVAQASASDGPLLQALTQRDLELSTSRCGDFKEALKLLESDPDLSAQLPQLITHRLPAEQLGEAFEIAQGPDCIKVVVEHGLAE